MVTACSSAAGPAAPAVPTSGSGSTTGASSAGSPAATAAPAATSGLPAAVAAMRRAGSVATDYRLDVLDVGAVRGTGTLGLAGDGPTAGEWSASVPDDEGVPRDVRVLAVRGSAYARPAGLPLPPGVAWVALPGTEPGAGRALVALADRLRLATDPVLLIGLLPPGAGGAGRPEPGPGPATTRYEAVVPLDAPPAGAEPAVVRELQRLRAAGGRALTVTVWVADGVPVRLSTALDGGSALASDVTFSGWGVPAAPAAPPAAAVVPLATVLAAP